MKIPKHLPLLLSITFLILAAGCISFGTQTADVVMEDRNVGTVAIIPLDDGTYAITYTLLGMEFSKNGVSESEVKKFNRNVKNGEIQIFDLFGLYLPENMGEPSNMDEFLDSIVNMPITNMNTETIGSSLSAADSVENANQSFSNLENIVSGFFGM